MSLAWMAAVVSVEGVIELVSVLPRSDVASTACDGAIKREKRIRTRSERSMVRACGEWATLRTGSVVSRGSRASADSS